MSTLTSFTAAESVIEATPQGDDAVRRQVWSVLANYFPIKRTVDRRLDQRFPYPHLLYLTPVADDGFTPQGESVVVVGKQLSERGVGFFYQQPITHRRMIASLEAHDLGWAAFVIDITWCRFTQHRWYESGGRFLQTVHSPIPPRQR